MLNTKIKTKEKSARGKKLRIQFDTSTEVKFEFLLEIFYVTTFYDVLNYSRRIN